MAGLRHFMQRHSGAKGWCGRGVLLLRSGIIYRMQLLEGIALEASKRGGAHMGDVHPCEIPTPGAGMRLHARTGR